MMSLEAQRAAWAADDEAKMALARKREAEDGPRGWQVSEDGTVSVVIDFAGEWVALPLPSMS